MQSGRCDSCFRPALPGKAHCLEHHKEQSNYTYGMDHELQKKMQDKFDPNKAAAARVWVESVTKRQLTADLQASLKSGVVLCDLINAIFPGSVARVNQGGMPFVQRENIVAYLDACKKHGMRETDCFVTQDLFEGSNISLVVDQLCALGQLASTKGYRGPQLVISGGAVQVASPQGRVAAPAQGQVPLTQPSYISPSNTAAQSQTSYRTAPTSSPALPPRGSPVAAAAVSSPPPAAAATNVPKFCGACGGKRADLSAKFCGECGAKF